MRATRNEVHRLLRLPEQDRCPGVCQEGHRVVRSRLARSTRWGTRARVCSLIHSDAIDAVMGTKKAEAIGQFDLFGGGDADDAIAGVFDVKIPDEEWDAKHRLALEREMLGLYVSGHRSMVWSMCSRPSPTRRSRAILEGDVKDGAQVIIGGILASVNRRINKNGLAWASAQFEDLAGGIEVLFFPQSYSVYGMDIAEDTVVLVKARVSVRDDRVSLIANDLAVPDLSAVGVAKPIAVSIADPDVHAGQGRRAEAGARPIPARRMCTSGMSALGRR